MKRLRTGVIFTLLFLLPGIAAYGAGISLQLTQPQGGSPLPANRVATTKVLEVAALEAATGGTPATEAKVFTYPLLHDSPDTSVPAAFGTLIPGTYRFAMQFRLLEDADRLRISLVAKPGSGDTTDFEDVNLFGLSNDRWYEVTGSITVIGPDVWNGRLTLVAQSAQGQVGNPLKIWLDEIELVQDPDLPGDGCDPDCLRSPLDFEQDPVGVRPDRVLSFVVQGTDGHVEVGDHLPWQAVPDWFESGRVHLATRLRARHCICDELDDPAVCTPITSGPNSYDIFSPTFLDAADLAQMLGIPALTRHVKWGPDGPWWPTSVPSTSPTYRPDCVNNPIEIEPNVPLVDVAQEIIDRAHQPHEPGAIDTRFIAYYWMMSDFGVRTSPPDASGVDGWTARNSDQTLATNDRGLFLTQNSPYPEVVAERLVELASRDADGIKFDVTHNPGDGDWSEWSRQDYIDAGHGTELPPFDLDVPGYWRLLDLYDQTVRSSFELYHRSVHRERAETALIVSAGDYQTLWEQPIRSTFVENQQIAKGEWHKTWRRLRLLLEEQLNIDSSEHHYHLPDRDVQSGLGFALLRDTTNGRPPHIWVRQPGQSVADADLSAAHVEISATGLLTYGNAANLDFNEPRIRRILDLGQDLNLDQNGGPYLRVGAYGDLASESLAGLRPHRWVGIHFNERARQNIYEDTSLGDIQERYREAWKKVISPTVWSFAALTERGVPVGVVTDQQLGRGELYGYGPGDDNAYDVLFLPSLDLSLQAQAEIQTFKDAGGRVVCSELGPQALCSDTGAHDQAWTWYAVAVGSGWDTSARDATIENFLDAVAHDRGVWTDGRVLDAPIEVYFVKDTATGTVPVAPHIGAFADPSGSGRLVIMLSNTWHDMLDDETLTVQQRADFQPPEIGGADGRIYLRRGLVDGTESFCYATLGDPSWKAIDAQHLHISTDSAGDIRAIIKLDDGDADASDDLNFTYGLIVEVKPTGTCGTT
ncbi:MAG: hypothetical protein MPN21_26930 [Thermoanaerobaculia bacterium]|nr:hypothetical protein [Thermoanaerobaculia bacterium]